MRVLLTGAFGNVGKNVLNLLLELGHTIRCFDVKNKKNEKTLASYVKEVWISRKLEVFWGDIRNREDIISSFNGIDAVIHLAAIIPPLSEKDLGLAKSVNVEGTRNIIEGIKMADTKPRFVFTSSISVYGPTMSLPPPRKVTDPLNPPDNYSAHKVECEKMLKESGLSWVILRVAAVSISDLFGSIDPIMYEVPLDQRIEFVHSKDVARACVNALTADVVGKVLHVGGGKESQMLQREFLKGIMGVAGVGMLPESAFKTPKEDSDWFYTDYLDTEEAQRLLHYQVLDFEDYCQELRAIIGGAGRFLAQVFSPPIRMALSFKSKYFKKHVKDKLRFRSKEEKE